MNKAPQNLSAEEQAAWYQLDSQAPNVVEPFTSYFGHGVLFDAQKSRYPFDSEFDVKLMSFGIDLTSPAMEVTPTGGTDFLFVSDGQINIWMQGICSAVVAAGCYACLPKAYTLQGEGSGIIIHQAGYKGMFSIGGPIEEEGRLKYIDGCTDSLLVPPVKKGDPCLNFLHFPPGIDQTMHTHPSVRIGMVARGRGVCVTPVGEYPLDPGTVFVIHTEGLHKFRTEGTSMDVVAFHPDSDFGPTDEEHPMLNRTIVNGTSAKLLDAIRTK